MCNIITGDHLMVAPNSRPTDGTTSGKLEQEASVIDAGDRRAGGQREHNARDIVAAQGQKGGGIG